MTPGFRHLLLANALLSLAAFSIAEGNLVVFAVVALLAIAGWWFNDRDARSTDRRWGLPRWLTTTLLAIVAVGAGYRGWRENEPISAFSWLLASILLLKIWEQRRIRDYGQVLTVCVFLSIGSTLTDASLALGVTLLAQLPVLAAAVMHFQAFSAASRVAGPRFGHLACAGKGVRRAVVTLSVVAVVCSVTIAVGAFVVIPRGIGWHQFTSFQPPIVGRVTGFADSIDLDQSGVISESQAPVLDLRVTDAHGRNIGSEDRAFYLRGSVLDAYRGREWTRGERRETMHPRLPGGEQSPDLAGGARMRAPPFDPETVINQQISMRSAPRGESPLFSVLFPRFVTPRREADLHADASTGTVLCELPSAGRFEYLVVSAPAVGGSTVRDRRGIVRHDSKVVAELVRSVLTNAGIEPDWSARPREEDGRTARILEAHLRSRCTYTLDAPAAPLKNDPIDWFLTVSKRGHCEYFASALAALCRSAGIDARVVAGYLATEFDPQTGSYIVRASNAHAWVEVNTAPGKWETFDATPPATLAAIREQGRTAFAWLGQWLAELHDAWNVQVVTFDQGTQERLLGANTGRHPWLLRMNSIMRGTSDESPLPRLSAPTAGQWILAICIVFGVVLVIGVARTFVRRRRRPGDTDADGWAFAGPYAVLHAQILASLDSINHPKPKWLPLLAHLKAIPGAPDPFRRSIVDAAQSLYAARFGGTPLAPSKARDLARGLRRSRI
ncbi:MAG: DUF3488 domain-containing protein [Planctomycetes bacterium]|nr:DUF3488 domain-containing protein [Planctomycetota bacterium]